MGQAATAPSNDVLDPHTAYDRQRTTTLKRRDAAVLGMLDELWARESLDRDRAADRIRAAVARIYDAQTGLLPPGGALGLWILLLAFLAAPALLLAWSGSERSFVIDVLLYTATLPLGGFLLGLAVFGYLDLSLRSDKERAEVIWAWIEVEEPEHHAVWAQVPHRGRRVIGVMLALVVMVTGLWWLRQPHGWPAELACLVLLAPLIAALLASVSAVARTRVQPYTSRRPVSAVPGDVTMINLLNLAFFSIRSASTWDEETTRQRILSECERAAAAAELEFSGDHLALRGDPQTSGWAHEQSAKLAATLRQLKRPALLATKPERYDAFIDTVADTLAAAVDGDWDALTSADAPPRTRRRLWRAITVLIPSALLTAAAFTLPEIPGLDIDDTAIDSVRASLLVAAFLALIGAISPDSQKAASAIQSVTDKFGPTRP